MRGNKSQGAMGRTAAGAGFRAGSFAIRDPCTGGDSHLSDGGKGWSGLWRCPAVYLCLGPTGPDHPGWYICRFSEGLSLDRTMVRGYGEG